MPTFTAYICGPLQPVITVCAYVRYAQGSTSLHDDSPDCHDRALDYILIAMQVGTGHTVLVHAAAGGVGSLLCQWANALGATVIGTVSNEEKAALAHLDGCHHVIIYTKEDVATRVKEITGGKGVNVVYDSVGKDTYKVRLLYQVLVWKLDSLGIHIFEPFDDTLCRTTIWRTL